VSADVPRTGPVPPLLAFSSLPRWVCRRTGARLIFRAGVLCHAPARQAPLEALPGTWAFAAAAAHARGLGYARTGFWPTPPPETPT
jgi:hypothetical protein